MGKKDSKQADMTADIEEPKEPSHESLEEPLQEADSGEEVSEDTGEASPAEDTNQTDTKIQSEMEEEEKRSRKDQKEEQIAELKDRLTRQMAEFDNFRKRTDKEKSQMYEIGARDVIEKLLPIIDNFERGLEAVSEEEKTSSFVEGMEKVYKQMLTTLEEIGVTPIEAVGHTFDPEFHNAVMHEEDPEQEENTIVQEFQKGYLYRDGVVRHSMVKVVN